MHHWKVKGFKTQKLCLLALSCSVQSCFSFPPIRQLQLQAVVGLSWAPGADPAPHPSAHIHIPWPAWGPCSGLAPVFQPTRLPRSSKKPPGLSLSACAAARAQPSQHRDLPLLFLHISRLLPDNFLQSLWWKLCSPRHQPLPTLQYHLKTSAYAALPIKNVNNFTQIYSWDSYKTV